MISVDIVFINRVYFLFINLVNELLVLRDAVTYRLHVICLLIVHGLVLNGTEGRSRKLLLLRLHTRIILLEHLVLIVTGHRLVLVISIRYRLTVNHVSIKI